MRDETKNARLDQTWLSSSSSPLIIIIAWSSLQDFLRIKRHQTPTNDPCMKVHLIHTQNSLSPSLSLQEEGRNDVNYAWEYWCQAGDSWKRLNIMVNRRKRKHSHTVTATGHNGLNVIGHWQGRISTQRSNCIIGDIISLSLSLSPFTLHKSH